MTSDHIKGTGDETFNIGADADVNKIDSGDGTNTMNTKSPSANQDSSEQTNVVCFGKDTLIEVAGGAVEVEDLLIGQGVATEDNGMQPVRWSGRTPVGVMAQLTKPKLRLIPIRAGALGKGLPERDLFVSQNHWILNFQLLRNVCQGTKMCWCPPRNCPRWTGSTR